jgi:hypothetical protein
MIRDEKLKKEFVEYIDKHPSERLWQSIRNFQAHNWIIASDIMPVEGQIDTFYWEGDRAKAGMENRE